MDPVRCAGVISRLSQTKRRLEEPLAQLGGVEVGHHRGEQLDASSTSMMRCGSPNSDGMRTSVARIRRCGRGCRAAQSPLRAAEPRRAAWLRRRREHDETCGDDRIAECEHRDRKPEARPGLGRAIDLRPWSKRAASRRRQAPRAARASFGARRRSEAMHATSSPWGAGQAPRRPLASVEDRALR